MLHQLCDFEIAREAGEVLEDSVLRHCGFAGLQMNGGIVTSSFLICTLKEIDWYWGIFSHANFVDCDFVQCTFSGTAFVDCRFVDCRFVSCKFEKDNLGAPCTFERTTFYGSTQSSCEGLYPEIPRA